MDIRSRAESLRPFRYLLSRQRDDEPGIAGSGETDDAASARRWRQAAVPSATGGSTGASGPIAIIGMGCRFPDADDPAGLLDLVLTGRQAFRRLPPCRVDLADYYSADRAAPDATYSARAALLEGWQFDLEAFGVPEPVYRATDPAHWLALETTARALAAAGFALGQGLARSRTGVIIGNTLTGDSSRAAALRLRWPYVRRVLAEALAAGDIPRERAIAVLRHAAQRYLAPFPAVTDETLAGSTPGAIASRICGYFGFRGGGYAVDGSQASSLLAVASACTALAAGDLDVAIAGGVDLSLDPLELVGLAKTGALARGEMRVFDESPTGFLPGEGCGMVVLMRSADARLNGLPVYADGPLAMTHSVNGELLPFGEVECDRVRTALQRTVGRGNPEAHQTEYGVALARVMAHEIYHMLEKSAAHTKDGLSKEALSATELSRGTPHLAIHTAKP
jgi:hypothetical protein